jgi:twinkle protein
MDAQRPQFSETAGHVASLVIAGRHEQCPSEGVSTLIRGEANVKTWEEVGIDVHGRGAGPEIKTTCPQCSPFRKKKSYRCLNVNLDKGVWHCWHCDWSGSLANGCDIPSQASRHSKVYRKPTYTLLAEVSQPMVEWFAARGIPEAVVRRHRIGFGRVYMPQLEDDVEAIQFPYYRQGEVVNIKYRDFDKNFRMAGGAERVLYGLDDIQGDTLIWVEGEPDKLAVEVAGHVSCVSVPDGAPSPNTKDYQAKFDYLASAEAILAPIRKHIIAVDDDLPGEKLAEELIRRLGPERCWRVQWPSGCKDANDVLMRDGPEALAECIHNAQPYPIAGIVRVRDLNDALTTLYAEGLPSGLSPGWGSLGRLYTVRPGELTVVTGIPGHGKSTLLSAMLINLAIQQGWTFAVCSPENVPLERYAARLLELYVGAPFSAGAVPRMSCAMLEDAKSWLDAHVSFLLPEAGA